MTDKNEAYADYIAAQAEMENATMNRINPHFKSKYADLSAVREATLPALTKNGLGIIQLPTIEDGSLVLVSRLVHKSGAIIEECRYPLSVNGSPQQKGSEITYARRYTWAALCGISSDEDDDGNSAEKAPKSEAKKTEPKKPVRSADDPNWNGPLGKSALKAALQEMGREINGCADISELDTYLPTQEKIIEQTKVDLPEWWFGNGDSRGLQGLIEKRKAELIEDPFEDEPPITAAG